ncbi:MAG: YebC/PmpR family DNA-binding transcriptional regulator [bacterium]|nr:YebC/PmpR family DNA-binding transcriptional regulator [candidate division WOR-3 bacterium]MDH5682882.1 YebC/PmpR family DNA-binding transcriptional regulator [candidate division WOR-3 bacterium]
MSGHSKWSQIKHKKAKADVQKGKIFSKLIREITTAARIGGSDMNANPRLRTAVELARAVNMPMDNIERAIKKGTGELPGVSYEEVEYEGYGPGGVAMIVRALTDNKNRTTSDVRHIFEKYGGNLGTTGCVAWQFQPKGVIAIPRVDADEDKVLAIALEAGADDVKTEADSFQIVTPPENFELVKNRLKEEKIEWSSAELTKLPQTTLPVDEKNAEKVLKLYEALEELDEVSQVFANFDIAEELMEKFSSNV